MTRKIADLLLVIALTLIAIVVILSGMQNIVRVLFATTLVFVFPGYTLVAAMFAHHPFRMETHLVFAIALSIAMAVLSGLFLHFMPWGLRTESWLVALASITLFASALAIIRRSFSPYFSSVRLHLNFTWPQLAMSGLTVLLVFIAIGLARNGIVNETQAGFTQLWLLPPASDSPDTAQVGIRNEETTFVSYRLVVSDGGSTLQNWDAIELAPGEEWQNQIDIQPSDDNINAQLYRNDSPASVYRSVSLALNGESSGP